LAATDGGGLMAIVAPVVTAFFDLPSNDATLFTLDDDVLGLLDTGGDLGGDIAADVSCSGYSISIARGRSMELNEIAAGTCRLSFRNGDRTFDPSYDAGPFFGNLIPGKRIEVSIAGVTLFVGKIDDLAGQYTPRDPSTASILLVDNLGALARNEFDEWHTSEQKPGARLHAILDRSEVRYAGGRDIDTGVETLQDDTVTWGSNVLNYAQLVARSDLGRLFDSRLGVLTFRDRLSIAGVDPVVTFADDLTDQPFSGINKRTASELLYTWVAVDRVGGVKQSAVDTDAELEAKGIRRLSLSGLLLNEDDRSAEMANFLLGIYHDATDRIAGLMVRLAGYDEADHALIAALDIGDVIGLRWTPDGIGDPAEHTLIVEGIQHSIDADGIHIMTISTSDALQTSPFTLDDDVLGLLDGVGLLAF
jgi:hypothetical protein